MFLFPELLYAHFYWYFRYFRVYKGCIEISQAQGMF